MRSFDKAKVYANLFGGNGVSMEESTILVAIKVYEHQTNRVLTAKDGLLFSNGLMVDLPIADYIACDLGYMYVEQLVRFLEKFQTKE